MDFSAKIYQKFDRLVKASITRKNKISEEELESLKRKLKNNFSAKERYLKEHFDDDLERVQVHIYVYKTEFLDLRLFQMSSELNCLNQFMYIIDLKQFQTDHEPLNFLLFSKYKAKIQYCNIG